MSPNVSFSGPTRRKGGNKKEQVLAALLAHPTQKAAAESVGISTRQLQRWLKEESFLSALQAAKSELVESMTTRLRANGFEATEALREVYVNPQPPPGSSARVAAARATIELATKAHENENLEIRIRKIEQDRGGNNEF
jgi:hypothetical protein